MTLQTQTKNGFIAHENSLTIFTQGKTYPVDSTHKNFQTILAALKAGDYSKVPDLVDVYKTLTTVAVNSDKLVIEGRRVYAVSEDGTRSQLAGYEVEKLLDLKAKGFRTAPIEKFILNIRKNPSEVARQRLYKFMEVGELPLSEEGTFLAYKVVRSTYFDKHSNKFFNGVGSVLEMPRSEVDDNDDRTCSTGFHACSKDYIKSFRSGGDRLVVVEIHPADVVSIPSDYNNTKLRTSKYTVIGEITALDDPEFFGKPVYSKEPAVKVTPTKITELSKPAAKAATLPQRDASGRFLKKSAPTPTKPTAPVRTGCGGC